jgi:hypothetical protein
LFMRPLVQQVFASVDSRDTADCRCYARQRALLDVFLQVTGLLDIKGTLTPLESRAVFAWYKILVGYLYEISGIHFKSLSTISSQDLASVYNRANTELFKHCQIGMRTNLTEPADCKFNQ